MLRFAARADFKREVPRPHKVDVACAIEKVHLGRMIYKRKCDYGSLYCALLFWSS